ncbi:MAG TPA: aldolase catalytic domain-containing protein [Candidatus Thermoplasmatota archaeon]|nr:aldolase catalytic domain-containing protein [Candidatus Thermoplasmatota archaeon]
MVKVLDCTLRDGGYYCEWDYADALVSRYLGAVAKAGVAYAEIGFRSPPSEGFGGKWKYSRDRSIRAFPAPEGLKLAVMLDAKEFSAGGRLDAEGLEALFAPRARSPVALVRVATTVKGVAVASEMAALLKRKGYEVAVNLMQASLLGEKEAIAAAADLESSEADHLYFADSFGGLSPVETRALFQAARSAFSRSLGFHAHDNLGLALSNTLAAIEGGADIVDGSVMGMGRGAGNLRTEQLLLYLRHKKGDASVDPTALFDVVSVEFEELHRRHQWGVNLAYMLSGVFNVHPTYAQQLLQGRRASPLEVVRTLQAIASGKGAASFSEAELSRALTRRFAGSAETVAVSTLPGYREGLPLPRDAATRPFLLLGSGPSVRERAADVNQLIEALDPVVVECNLQSAIRRATDHYSVFSNQRRIEECVAQAARGGNPIVLGMQGLSADCHEALRAAPDVRHYGCHVSPGTSTRGRTAA